MCVQKCLQPFEEPECLAAVLLVTCVRSGRLCWQALSTPQQHSDYAVLASAWRKMQKHLGSQAIKMYTLMMPFFSVNESNDPVRLHGQSQAKVHNDQPARLHILQIAMREYAPGYRYSPQNFSKHIGAKGKVASIITSMSIRHFDWYCFRPVR